MLWTPEGSGKLLVPLGGGWATAEPPPEPPEKVFWTLPGGYL